MNLTQKETSLLSDMKEQEKICIEKYAKASAEACDSQLKTLFNQLGQQEQTHLNTLNQISSGTVPSMQAGSGGQQQQQQQTSSQSYNYSGSEQDKQKDSFLCSDLLSTEKHVSSVYNTAIFEFRDHNVRTALNHIQKEEQQHGEEIYNYMSQNGMYS